MQQTETPAKFFQGALTGRWYFGTHFTKDGTRALKRSDVHDDLKRILANPDDPVFADRWTTRPRQRLARDPATGQWWFLVGREGYEVTDAIHAMIQDHARGELTLV